MPASEAKKLPGIFISYRRADSPDATGRIYDRLVSEFGKARVFKDVDSIPLGQDFRGHLNEIIGGCVAVLAIIGPKWIDTRNSAGQRRLEDPDDFVRIELEAALSRDIPVVPVLVGHAPMPGTPDLPVSLVSMAYRQSIEVRPDPDFHNDATRLVAALRAIVDPDGLIVAPAAIAATKRGQFISWMAAFAIAVLAAAGLAIPALKHLREAPPAETRIAIPMPVQDFLVPFALSPDGRQIVYMSSDDPQNRLWLRALSAATAQPLAGTEGATAPFWSPDGRSIGFFALGSLKRLDLVTGRPQVLANATGEPSGAWGPAGDIVFNPGLNSAVARIAATGGPVVEVAKVAPQSIGHRVLCFLPDGKHFIYVSLRGKEEGTYLGTVDGSSAVRLTSDIGPGVYLPSGWLLLVVGAANTSPINGVLVAQRLDLRNARLTGERVIIASGVGSVSASATGLVVYRSAQTMGLRQLTWVSRSGTELGKVGDADGTLSAPRVAPDGYRVLVSRITQENRDLWLLDGVRASRLTSDAQQDGYPIWSPDGSRIVFTSDRSGRFALYMKLASGVGGEELLRATGEDTYASSWSKDGRYLVYFALNSKNSTDIFAVPITGDRKPFALLNTPFLDLWGQLSPDGRWLAYQSDETGKYEVYVRPFQPTSAVSKGDPTGASQWLVSTSGGVHPLWSADGKELYFLNRDGEMMAAPIKAKGSALVPGTPVMLFKARIWGGGVDNSTGRQYDVAADGRFLINRETDADAIPTVTLIQNWNPDAKH